jgi:hypothetical protein
VGIVPLETIPRNSTDPLEFALDEPVDMRRFLPQVAQAAN